MTESISIVTIAHDGYGKFIPRFLESACNQKVKPKEVVIILSYNHGAGDIPKQVNGVDVRVIDIPVRHKRGVLRNMAMEQIESEWIMFFDVDDVLLPNAIKEIEKQSDADIVALRYYKEYKGKRTEMETPIPEIEKLPQWRKYYCNASGYIAFRKSLDIDHENLETPDYPFYFEALSKGARFKHTEKPCAVYKKTDDGHAKKKTPEDEDEDFTMIQKYAEYYYSKDKIFDLEKNIHQTWVGPHPIPEKWMQTWKDKHPDWNYILWDNETIKDLDINCKAFDYYWENEMWAGVADIVRYHALYKYGGFQPGADSICLNRINDIIDDHELYTVASHAVDKNNWQRVDGLPEDGQKIHFLDRKNKKHKDSISPIHGARKGHWFLEAIINEINSLTKFDKPYKTTGNELCERMVKKYKPKIKILPMHTFIPERTARTNPPRKYKYVGNGKVYSKHLYYTTNELWNSEY